MKKVFGLTALALALQFSLPLAGIIATAANAQEEPAPKPEAPPKPDTDAR